MLEKLRTILSGIGEQIGLVQFYDIETENHELHIQATPNTCTFIEILKSDEMKKVLQMDYALTQENEYVQAQKSFRYFNRPGNHVEKIELTAVKFFNVILKKIVLFNQNNS